MGNAMWVTAIAPDHLREREKPSITRNFMITSAHASKAIAAAAIRFISRKSGQVQLISTAY
jgi:hypothetical protein